MRQARPSPDWKTLASPGKGWAGSSGPEEKALDMALRPQGNMGYVGQTGSPWCTPIPWSPKTRRLTWISSNP